MCKAYLHICDNLYNTTWDVGCANLEQGGAGQAQLSDSLIACLQLRYSFDVCLQLPVSFAGSFTCRTSEVRVERSLVLKACSELVTKTKATF